MANQFNDKCPDKMKREAHAKIRAAAQRVREVSELYGINIELKDKLTRMDFTLFSIARNMEKELTKEGE